MFGRSGRRRAAHSHKLVRGYLEREGFSVRTVEDGLAAVELVPIQKPDVVVLDLTLPGIDGIEVCRQIRTFSDAYVLMLTARAEEIDRIVGLSVGGTTTSSSLSRRVSLSPARVMCRNPEWQQSAV